MNSIRNRFHRAWIEETKNVINEWLPYVFATLLVAFLIFANVAILLTSLLILREMFQ